MPLNKTITNNGNFLKKIISLKPGYIKPFVTS